MMDTKISNKTKIFNFVRRLFFNRIFELILLKIVSGKSPSSFWVKLIPNNYQYKKNTVRVVEREGLKYILDISDYMDWYIYFNIYDKSRNNLYTHLQENDIVFDVGANFGETSLKMSRSVGNNGKVYSFEPDLNNYEKLKTNVDLNKCTNIFIFKIGLGDENSVASISISSEHNSGMNKIELNSKNENQIKILRLDDFVKENNINKIDLIKIDVEGFEMNVLKGALLTLNVYSPRLFIEIDDKLLHHYNSSPQEIFNFLKSLNYKIYDAYSNELIDLNISYTNCHFDIYAKK